MRRTDLAMTIPGTDDPPPVADDASPNAVEIRLAHSALDHVVARIRIWVDRQAHQPKTLRYRFDEQEVLLSVDFAGRTDAEAFARAFSGKLLF